MGTATAALVLKVDVRLNPYGIPFAEVLASGDTSMSRLEEAAAEALVDYRTELGRAPFPGGVVLDEPVGQIGPDTFRAIYVPERIL